MSQINVDTITNRSGTGGPSFPSGATVTGVLTATTFSGNITGNATGLSGTPNITVGTIDATSLNSSGVVTATSFSGSGANLTGLVAGVGIRTSGGNVGTGATFLDFRGSGISTVTVGSGIATINVTGGGGGGKFSSVNYVFFSL